jgi:hypothetical protein
MRPCEHQVGKAGHCLEWGCWNHLYKCPIHSPEAGPAGMCTQVIQAHDEVSGFCTQCGGDGVESALYAHRIFGKDVMLHCDCVSEWMIDNYDK